MATWTHEGLAHTKRGYNCWVHVHPDSEVPICVGPGDDPEEICRIAELIEHAEQFARAAGKEWYPTECPDHGVGACSCERSVPGHWGRAKAKQ